MKFIYGAIVDMFGPSSMVVLPDTFSCSCGKAAMLVVNRDGKTRCVDCDAKYCITEYGQKEVEG